MSQTLARVRCAAGELPFAVDTLISAGFLVAAGLAVNIDLTISESDPTYQPPATWLLALTTLGITVPLAWRRRLPLLVLPVVIATFIVGRLVGNPDVDVALFAIPLAVYSAGAYGDLRWRAAVFAITTTAAMAELGYELLQTIPEYTGFWLARGFDFAYNLAMFGVAWALGTGARARREQVLELARRAAELEHQKAENARRAVFQERVSVARDLHDIVAHHVSVMGVQAGAARHVLRRNPDKASEALASVEATSRQAIHELHRMLGYLRQDGEAEQTATAPSLADLDQLVTQLADAGLRIRASVEGAQRPLPDSIELSAYRIVQEALTNTVKHAAATSVHLRLCYADNAFEVDIADDGHGCPADSPTTIAQDGTPRTRHPTGAGHGIIGMRERVRLHGGRLEVGPRGDGGFGVHAYFPMAGPDR